MGMEEKVLEEVGFTKSEAKVYLALLELGSSRAGQVLQKIPLHSSVLHFSLNSLIGKGILTYIKKGKARIYQATDPENLQIFLQQKQDALKSILPQLKKKQQQASEKEEAEIYEGVQGIAIALNSLIEDAKRGEEFLFFSSDLQEKDQEIQRFHKRYYAKRKEKKLIVKGIAPKRLERIFNEREIKNVKYVDFPIPENTGICGNKLVIFSWGEKPKAILITSKTIVEKQRKFFNQIWEMIR